MPRRTNRIIDCGDYCKIELYYPYCYIINDSTLNNLEAQIPEILKAIGG